MARGEYLLLTDADIVHPPDSVAGLVARAREGGYDLVSYMVRLHCGTRAEQALIPAFVFFFFLLYPPEWIAMAGREDCRSGWRMHSYPAGGAGADRRGRADSQRTD